jgi:hypothetical protein
VNWKQLRGVPAVIADGKDGGITGITLTTITAYATLGSAVGSWGTADAVCPAGKVVGGGYLQPQANVRIADSLPVGSATWRVTGRVVESVGYMVEIQAIAICLATEPAASLKSRSRG